MCCGTCGLFKVQQTFVYIHTHILLKVGFFTHTDIGLGRGSYFCSIRCEWKWQFVRFRVKAFRNIAHFCWPSRASNFFLKKCMSQPAIALPVWKRGCPSTTCRYMGEKQIFLYAVDFEGCWLISWWWWELIETETNKKIWLGWKSIKDVPDQGSPAGGFPHTTITILLGCKLMGSEKKI